MGCFIWSCSAKDVTNRTSIQVVVGETAGLSFECAQLVLVWVVIAAFIYCFRFRHNVVVACAKPSQRKACQPLKGVPAVLFLDFLECCRVISSAGGNLFSNADNLLTTRQLAKTYSHLFWMRRLSIWLKLERDDISPGDGMIIPERKGLRRESGN